MMSMKPTTHGLQFRPITKLSIMYSYILTSTGFGGSSSFFPAFKHNSIIDLKSCGKGLPFRFQ